MGLTQTWARGEPVFRSRLWRIEAAVRRPTKRRGACWGVFRLRIAQNQSFVSHNAVCDLGFLGETGTKTRAGHTHVWFPKHPSCSALRNL